ncbi:MAG: hypothetical protein SLRJCFUN_002459 [Candidatus Fervidibacter sp.]
MPNSSLRRLRRAILYSFFVHEIAVAALEAGKHVQVEKPMAISVRAGRLMVDAARRNGKVLMVAESIRYNPLNRMVR